MRDIARRVGPDLWPRSSGALIAVAVGLTLVLLRLPLQPVLKGQAPFLLAWPGIIAAAFLGGFWPAILVTVVSIGVGHHVLVSAGLRGVGPLGAAILFAFGLVFAAAGGMRKRHLRKAKADAERIGEMEARLLHVARLNAMGEMAGALAHELNQPLTAITSYVGAARRHIQRDGAQAATVSELLEKVSEQALRARDIISRIRGYVSTGEMQLTPQSLPGMVEEALAIGVLGIHRKAVTIRVDLARDCETVLADRIQVQQVLVNLFRNAVEAIGDRSRRELHVSSRREADGMIRITVSDTGPGIDPAVAARLFEPFVTSKDQGMGVGLSISRNIVEAHGGRMWTEAVEGRGATFHLTLRGADPGGTADER